ncbi:P2 [Grapevine associated cogu-like virus 1]|uniref:P2 n=1 Tax=Grapevine associated cogu-like virus 1 TaxID=2716183 RepID=A0A6G7M5H0_9VIRU|nr:P2 [Grapevine associated cogu-like virus 1]QIJ25705.1 P2 [Grapevine associated cogu-like virus 1]
MSLMKRFSRRLSGSGKPEKRQRTPSGKKHVNLVDNPVPNERQMTTANLFNTVATSAEQSTNMDRTLYEIPQPANVDAMTDMIKNHVAGDLFPYVGVVGSEGESADARRARLLALKPSYNKRDVPEIKVLGCPLISREGDFTMDSLMKFAKQNTEPIPIGTGPIPQGAHSQDFSISKPYIHIRQVTALFTPNVSSSSNYCNFWMNLIDNRLINSDRGSQTNVVVSNQESIMEMSCDYCVSRADLSSFSLAYTLERDIVHPGHQWGTASFYFSITESDLPFQSSKVDSMGVYRMPITTLMERETNADKSDISFTPADIISLRKLLKAGDIVDVDQPQQARLKTNTYSKSSIRAAPKGQEIVSANQEGWGFMKGAVKPKVDAMQASVDPGSIDEYQPHEYNFKEIESSRKMALERYKAQQEEDRKQSEAIKEIPKAYQAFSSSDVDESFHDEDSVKENQDEALSSFFGNSKKKVNFKASGA